MCLCMHAYVRACMCTYVNVHVCVCSNLGIVCSQIPWKREVMTEFVAFAIDFLVIYMHIYIQIKLNIQKVAIIYESYNAIDTKLHDVKSRLLS